MDANETLLTPEQDAALHAILEGKNVFLAGPSGSGKNTVLNKAALLLEEKGMAVGRCSQSMLGASHINGVTLNTFFNLPLKLLGEEGLCVPDVTKLCKVQVLLVNYIHTCTPPLIDILWEALRMAEEKGHSVQVVFSGDPFALNSVMDYESCEQYKALTGQSLESNSPFLSRHWADFNLLPYELTKDLRHEEAASRCIEALRFGHADGINRLKLLSAKVPVPGATWICSNKTLAKKKNYELTNSFPGVVHVFNADIHGKVSAQESPMPFTLMLKVGMPIIMVLNVPAKRLSSGTVGKVISIHEDKVYGAFPDRKGRILLEKQVWNSPEGEGSILQFPIDAGFAVTVYRARQMFLEQANLCGKFRHPGQLYNAVSRVLDPGKVFIDHGLTPKDACVDSLVNRWYHLAVRKADKGSPEAVLPRRPVPYGSRCGLRFGIKNYSLPKHDITRTFICLMTADGRRCVAFTDYARYIQPKKKKKKVNNGLGDSAYFIVLFLNYAFIDGPNTVDSLSEVTAETIRSFLSDYALGLYGKEGATHTEATVDRCVQKTIQFLKALLEDPAVKTRFSSGDLVVKKETQSKYNRPYKPGEELAFNIPYNTTDHKTLRDMPPEVVQEMVTVAYEEYPMLLGNIALGLSGGLRPSESCCLTLDNIQILYTGNEITFVSIDLEHTVELRDDGVDVGSIKVPRKVTIQKMYLTLFEALFSRFLAWRQQQKGADVHSALCLNTQGKAMTYRSLLYHFKKLLNKVVNNLCDSQDPRTIRFIQEYTKYSFGAHILRHIFTENLVLAGYEVSDVMNARGDHSPLSALTYLQDKGRLLEKEHAAVTTLVGMLRDAGFAVYGKEK